MLHGPGSPPQAGPSGAGGGDVCGHIVGHAWRERVATGSMARVSQPSPLTGARQHAQALAGSGDLGGARAVLEHAVDLGRIRLGEDDPDVLATALQLAQVLRAADDSAGARRVLEEAYAAGQWRLGDANALMVLISHDLGVVAEELGNRHEARKAFGRVAGQGPGVLGSDHWAVVRARAYLGEEPPTVRLELPAPAPGQETQYRDARQPAYRSPADDGREAYPARTAHDVGQPATPDDPAWEGGPAPSVPERRQPGPPPAHPVRHIVSAPSGAEVRQGTERSAYGRRGPALFAAIAAVLAAVIAVVALVVVLAQRGGGDGDRDVPTLGGGPAPTDVRLRDFGSSVQVYWTDPANGTTSFIVSGGHPGDVLKPMGQVSPGQTSFGLNGLNADLDYCFAVVAVYSTKDFSSSPQACTSRTKGTPRPSTTG